MNEKPDEVTVSGVTCKIADLSEEARAQLSSLQFVDAEIARLNAKLAVYTTARMAYCNALEQAMPRTTQ